MDKEEITWVSALVKKTIPTTVHNNNKTEHYLPQQTIKCLLQQYNQSITPIQRTVTHKSEPQTNHYTTYTKDHYYTSLTSYSY